MGVVYLARDPLIGRLVAIKTFELSPSVEAAERKHLRSRFIREAQSAGMLSEHPGIVTIHDVAETGSSGGAFIAMEYVEGTNLKDVMRRGEAIDLPVIADLVGQIAEALDYAHERGVVHRDVKPANVLVTRDRRVKITDFGIARIEASNLTRDGQMLGTPNYMAPEQVKGTEVDHRADIFSLGVIIYELLTRKKPFQGENLTVVTHRIVYDDFTPPEEHVPDLPAGLTGILQKALAKSPARRYAKAGEMADALGRVIENHLGLPNERAAVAGGDPPAVPAAPARVGAESVPGAVVEEATPSPEASPALAAPADDLGQPERAAPVASPSGRRAASSLARWETVLEGRGTSLGRLLAIGSMAAAVALLLAGGLVVWANGRIPEAPPDDGSSRRQAQFLSLMKEGRRAMQANDPATAAVVFRRAERLAPQPARVRRLADDAQRSIATGERREALLTVAREALDERNYLDARAGALGVLEIVAEDPEALEILAAADEALERRRASEGRSAAVSPRDPGRAGPRRTPRRPAADPPTLSARPSAEAPRGPPADLAVEFTTERPEGTVRLLADDEVIFARSFAFYEKGGLFGKRKIPQSGKITAPPLRLASGVRTLVVEVDLEGSSRLLRRQVRVDVPANGRVRLRIAVPRTGDVSLEID